MSTVAGPVVRIGTRGSALALAQTEMVAAAIAERGYRPEIVTIATAGDLRTPDTQWGEGAFVGALEEALADGRVDLAVHSAKDVPTDEHPHLRIGAYLRRATPLDALVLPAGASGGLDDLPSGAVVGTDSPRRRGFLLARRPDLEVRPLHGNVDTRLRRLDGGEADALVLAAAGLERLGRADRISALFDAAVVPPAPGQGAIAVQARADDEAVGQLLAFIDDFATRVAVEAERSLLAATGGGCRAPLGALATVEAGGISILAGFVTLDGRTAGFETIAGDARDAPRMARELAARIVARRATVTGAPRVIITRPEADALAVAARLAELGVAPVIVPAIAIESAADPGMPELLASLSEFDWAVVTSANGARVVADAGVRAGARREMGGVRWAAVGRTSGRVLAAAGATAVWLPSTASASALADELPVAAGQRVAWFRGSLADDGLGDRLRERGALVTAVTVYRTIEGPGASRALLADALSGGRVDAVILASPSAVRGLLSIAPENAAESIRGIPAVCVGPRTARAARDAGFTVVGESPTPDAATLAEVAAEYVSRVAA